MKTTLIFILTALLTSSCTTASKTRAYHDGKTFGRNVLRTGGALMLDTFNQWLEEQK